jgi:methylated-DNA-[protein]-cysteine S-methyltransferase
MRRIGLVTPVGPFWVEAKDGVIVASGWGDQPDPPPEEDPEPVLVQAREELQAYFAGSKAGFGVPMRPAVSVLTARVLHLMRQIPFGETRTYGALATDLGVPAQAVGQACGANPIPVLIPCHRILAASGLGGFSAPGGVETKVALLKLEGAASLLI